jgi:16S rRNA (cytidine1402-2'-O)-methyltransferase
MSGTLFVVATPIGNLEDLSFRALRTLKEVHLIAAEDTRRTSKLLAHYAIQKPLVSLREHNERRETPKLLARLAAGESIALVSDAGTPGIADPGQHLVRSARNSGIKVTPIPGASAVMAALSATGISSDKFLFLGFIPRSGSERERWIDEVEKAKIPVVFFEAPHRIRKTIDELSHILVERPIHIHRELSKIHEEYIIRPNFSENSAVADVGEFVVVVEPQNIADSAIKLSEADVTMAIRIIDYLTEKESIDRNEAERMTALALSADQRSLKNAVKKARIRKRREDDRLS